MKKAFLNKVEHIDDYIDRAEALIQKYVPYILFFGFIYFLPALITIFTR